MSFGAVISEGRGDAPADLTDHRRNDDRFCSLLLRAIDVYGDPAKWSQQKGAAVHRLFVCEHDEVSAVIVVSADDAWPGNDRPGLVRVGLSE